MAHAIGSIWGNGHDIVVTTDQAQYLTDDEISRFLDDLDHNGDGLIDYDEVEQKLDAVHDELIPQPREHNFLARRKTQQLFRRFTRTHSHAPVMIATNNNNHHHRNNINNNTHLNANHAWDDRNSQDGGNITTTTTRATYTTRGEGRGGAVSPAQSQRSRGEHGNLRHEFLRSIIGSDARRIPRDEFAERVRQWNIPSLELGGGQSSRDYVRKMSIFRRIRAYWAVHGPETAFLMLVISLQLAFGIWQLIKYTAGEQYRDAFGWGVGMAKAFAGALYPTMFFLVISMSRYVSTFLRRSYCLSRFINWDLSQSFHIKIAIVALVFSTLHAVGHLTGTFQIGSEEDREDDVAIVLGQDDVPAPYTHYIVSTPGLTGLTALFLFYLLALLSMPQVRRRNYEVFQVGHLLMYPIIGLLCAHGSASLLQFPMLGYWLAIPTSFVLLERVVRVGMGFHHISATLRVLDGETVEVTVMIPEERSWAYRPGQYVFFQVPKISRFQWHPFTVSVCVGKKMQLHIKTDGNWTGRLREMADESGAATEITVGINGPFGAPAQRFYDYHHAIIVGSGIGVTPFSGILSDLQARDDALHGGPGSRLHMEKMNGWNGFSSSESERLPPVREDGNAAAAPDEVDEKGEKKKKKKKKKNDKKSDEPSTPMMDRNIHMEALKKSTPKKSPDYRRVDFHWTVRERNYLLWMSELLNNVFLSQQWHRQRKLDEQEQRRLQMAADGVSGCGGGPDQLLLSGPLNRTLSRKSSYIPPPNLPSTPASRVPPPHLPPPPAPPLQVPFHSEHNKEEEEENSASPAQKDKRATKSLEDLDTLPHLDIRIHTHITGILSKSKSIATHVYAWLLETHRTAAHPASPLTGLLNPTQFGRPDFVAILDQHYDDMVRLHARDRRRKEVEKEMKERERELRAREKERRTRGRREQSREGKLHRRRERVKSGGHGPSKSTSSISSSIRSGFTGKTRYHRSGISRNVSASASVRASAVSSFGPDGARNSAVSFGGGGGGGRTSYWGGKRQSSSDMTLSSTGRVDSLYVYSSSAATATRTWTMARNASSARSRNPSSTRAASGPALGPTVPPIPISRPDSPDGGPGHISFATVAETGTPVEGETAMSETGGAEGEGDGRDGNAMGTPGPTLDIPETPVTGAIPGSGGTGEVLRAGGGGGAGAGAGTGTGNGSGTGTGGQDILRVGVFYCGTPAVGEILADRCRALTARGQADGTGIEYHFMTEVFG